MYFGKGLHDHQLWSEGSNSEGRQADDGIIADQSDAFQGDVARALEGPLVILLEQDRADETGDGSFVGKDADDLGPAFDLAVQALQRIGAVKLDPMCGREAHVGHNAIGRISCRIKEFRRVATRYDRLAINYLGAVCITGTVTYWL